MSDISISSIGHDQHGHIRILKISGSLDAATYSELEKEAQSVMSGEAIHLILDLSDTVYMGSAGLRAFHTLSKQLGEKNGKLVLLQPSDQVARVLKTLGFDTYFATHDSLEDAINATG